MIPADNIAKLRTISAAYYGLCERWLQLSNQS